MKSEWACLAEVSAKADVWSERVSDCSQKLRRDATVEGDKRRKEIFATESFCPLHQRA